MTRSLMAVPITYQGEKLGVLEVVNKAGEANYTEEDLTILETSGIPGSHCNPEYAPC